VVRCFLPNLDNRLGTIHELYTAIHKTFQEEGIEIAFPQLDLHVRSGAELLNEAGQPQAGTSAS
jgi:potassium efflux system protein